MVKIQRILSLFVFTLISFVSSAQCAMCKAANEDREGGAEGFNAAILFLMSVPYFIGAVVLIVFIVYFKKRKSSAVLEDQ